MEYEAQDLFNHHWDHPRSANTVYELTARYGTPEDKGRYGFIYRCVLPKYTLKHVTVTCYASTNVVSVQGLLHGTWVDTILADIGEKINDEDNHMSHLIMLLHQHQVSQSLISMLNYPNHLSSLELVIAMLVRKQIMYLMKPQSKNKTANSTGQNKES